MKSLLVAVFGLCLVSARARSFEEHKWRDGIQVWQNSRKGREIMWGRCSGWFHKLKSCILQETTCAAHLSEGPADADVEVRLGNLPVFENHPTYVQWWAARKSDQPYDPFSNPEEATVFDDMFQAYPRYYDPDFNGGNVQVDGNGEAVIKFRAPATHLIGKHARVPHVHVRVCSSGQRFSIILGRRDKVQLTANGPVAKSECNNEENKLHIVNFRSLRPPLQNDLVQTGMNLANKFWEELDLDTLEFSPVFQCLSSRLLYDHIEGDCAESCPQGSVLTHGQCVKPATRMQSFSATWDLQVCGCDERCWSDKRDMTLHNLRLEIADHMDIPLHEVHELDISFLRGSRPGTASLARMHIRITSPRHTLETGTSMLRSLFYNFERSSEVLKMLVLASREVSASDVGFLHKRVHVGSEDAYAPYYQDLDMVKESESMEATADMNSVVPDMNSVGSSKPVDVSRSPSFGFSCMFCACILALMLPLCYRACSRRAKASEPTLRSLGDPLASIEDPPLFQGRNPVRDAVQNQQSCIVQASVVQQYLVTLYDRALQ
eukprot:TRINITY_DN15973_c0_g1_i1.p1 TRINITY_DN15973_c0_g1~~TRINITY_DN15973_c0_g1_i1.p1  ORF type:complete len:567 (-),score=82.90 TRINITY_DN15973_c0_g1_i1:311-1954(-)